MAIKAFYSTQDEIPEQLRDFYKQQEDGRFKFDAEDVEDVKGLKSALEHERTERRSAKERLAEFEGIDAKLARELLQEHEKGVRKKAIDEDKVEELINSEVEKRITKMQEKHTNELGGVSQERDRLRQRLEAVLIDNALSMEATKAGVLADALPDVVRRGRERFHLQEDAVVAKDAEGNILYGSDGKTSQTVGEFMEELKGGARHLFAPSKGGGANRDFNSGHSGAGQGNQSLRGIERMRAAHTNQ